MRGPAVQNGGTGGGVGQILEITHPGDNTTIIYTYGSDPHYVVTVTDERGNVTSHTRDPVTHRITRTDYKDADGNILAFETFTYNNFGQVLTHQLRNGAYEHFQVSSNRGLLIAKWNPTLNSTPLSTDPHTTYTYYPVRDIIGQIG